MRLTLVRHATSEGNAQRLIQGHTDYALTAQGRREAALLAQRLAGERYDRIYVSDLSRAAETAELIIESHPQAQVIFDPRLRERAYGAYEGRPKPELVALGTEPEAGTWVAPPGGEHLDEFTRRVTSVLDELFERHRGESVLVVSHSGVLTRILLTLARATDDDYARYRPRNASVTVIEFDLEKNHEIHLLSCCEHLEDRNGSSPKLTNGSENERSSTHAPMRHSSMSGL